MLDFFCTFALRFENLGKQGKKIRVNKNEEQQDFWGVWIRIRFWRDSALVYFLELFWRKEYDRRAIWSDC